MKFKDGSFYGEVILLQFYVIKILEDEVGIRIRAEQNGDEALIRKVNIEAFNQNIETDIVDLPEFSAAI